jgi:hypothetical protein
MSGPRKDDPPRHRRKPRLGGRADYSPPGTEHLERRAAAKGWATAERDKRLIVKRLRDIIDLKTPEGKAAKLRSVLIAARTLASADLRQQALELQREISLGGVTAGTLADLVGDAEARADELDRERQGHESAGPTGEPAGPLPE